MKKLRILAVLAVVLFGFQAADLSAVVIKRRPHRRTVVVVHKGFPIVRPARHVVIHFDWAEVVFGNGEAQVLDMKEFVREPGFYLLLDFANGREIDHVRMVAKSETPLARVVLKIQK